LLGVIPPDALADIAREAGWMELLFATLFNPEWNQTHAVAIWALILGILVLTGIGLPAPEDIWLTLAGFSAFKQSGDVFAWYAYALAFAACTTAILIGDSGAWWLGRRFGFGIRDRFKFMRTVLNEKRMRRVQGWFDNYGSWTVFFGRQIAGVRFVTFFSAGTMRMPLTKFWFFDFLGCFVSIPLWFALGGLAAVYGQGWLDEASKVAGGGILAAAAVGVIVFVVVVKVRSARRAKRDAELLETEIRVTARNASSPSLPRIGSEV
jgi:membrane protein DedA with SNARE-associated domain